MEKTFNTADELMNYLKSQIFAYDQGEEVNFERKFDYNNNLQVMNLEAFRSNIDLNNNLWNVSANRPITSHRKGIGKFIVSAKRLVRKSLKWYVGDTFDLQSSFNGSVTNSFNELYNIINVYNATLNQQNLQISDLRNQNEILLEQINLAIDEKMEKKFKDKCEEDNKFFDIYRNQFKELYNTVKILSEENKEKEIRINQLNEEIKATSIRLAMFRDFAKEMTQSFKVNVAQNNIVENSSLLNSKQKLLQSEQIFDYLSFENKFRGSEEDIKNRQTAYITYFTGKQSVLDIGCGRGEFVELMLENGIGITGIDLNQDMVDLCREKDLPVFKLDAIYYLNSVEDESLDGIFMGQVIEHMPTDLIIEIVQLAYQKLKKDSYLIMETPNPLTLAIYSRFFYVDPTHVKPVHPYTASYYVEQAGFNNIEIKYSGRVEEELHIPKIKANQEIIDNIEEINLSIDRLNDLLYGNQDYAIIAKK